MSVLELFFAVTMTSIYEVIARDEKGFPYARKIALREKSFFPVDAIIKDQLLAVAKQLQFYTPEGHGFLSSQTSVERQLEMVPIEWYGPNTSFIVALFFTEKEARDCFCMPNLKPCDPRWLEETRTVIAAIGEEHPTITICHHPDMELELLAK